MAADCDQVRKVPLFLLGQSGYRFDIARKRSSGCGQGWGWNKSKGRDGISSQKQADFTQGTCMGSRRPGTRGSGNIRFQDGLQMGRSERG